MRMTAEYIFETDRCKRCLTLYGTPPPNLGTMLTTLEALYSRSTLFVCGITADAVRRSVDDATDANINRLIRRALNAFVTERMGLVCAFEVILHEEDAKAARRTARIIFDKTADCRAMLEDDERRFSAPFGGRLEPAVADPKALDEDTTKPFEIAIPASHQDDEAEAARSAFLLLRSVGAIISVKPWTYRGATIVRFMHRRSVAAAKRLLHRLHQEQLQNHRSMMMRTARTRWMIGDPVVFPPFKGTAVVPPLCAAGSCVSVSA